MKKMNVITRLLIFFAILIVINLISEKLFFRLDFTEDKRYTLSEATKQTLQGLEDVITITVYFTEDLPPQLLSTRKDFENLLIEYEKMSGGNIVYKFTNPNESPQQENEAQQNGISPIIINVTKSDQVKQLRAYMGAMLQMGEKTESIPIIQPGSGMEYGLTTAIKKLAITDKPKIAFVQGHGEPSLNELTQFHRQLSVMYDPETFTITDTTNIPVYYKALVIINPVDTIPENHFRKIDRYLESNGNLFIAFSNLTGELNQGIFRTAPDIGINNWLQSKGVSIGKMVIIDANSASIGVQQRQGPFVINTQVKFPYFPIIGDFSDHPISEGLESLLLPLVSPVIAQGDSSVNVTILAQTSENSGLVSAPVYIDINKQWTLGDFRDDPQPVAIALEGKIGNANQARMVVVSNGNFIVNGTGQNAQQLNPDNVNFASNIIDWLSDDTGLIDLRTKGITNRPLKQLEDGEKAVIKYANVFAPILLILMYAFIRKQRYLKKKQNWLQGIY